jgi:hypothetical protein
MTVDQDPPTRRIFVFTPKQILLDRIAEKYDEELSFEFINPTVVMTKKIPYEKYMEGWRKQIIEKCKERFAFEMTDFINTIHSNEILQTIFEVRDIKSENIEKWWSITEADDDYEIETTWCKYP